MTEVPTDATGHHLVEAEPPPSVVGRRFDNLDVLRAIAALSVVCEHALTYRPSGYRSFSLHYLNLGVFGVTLFFLVSGFIIPRSLERSRGVVTFWINRVTRLYPLLWFALALAAVAAAAGRYRLPRRFGLHGWLANATMVPSQFHVFAVGPLWTLRYELVFYLALSVLLVLRLHRHTVLIAGGFLLLVAVRVMLESGPPGAHLGAFWYATFFIGGVLGRVWTGELGRRRGTVVYAALAVGYLAVIALSSPTASGTQGDTPALSALTSLLSRGSAMLLFAVVVLARRTSFPRVIAWLGMISYSIYLLHVTVIEVVPAVGGTYLSTLVWVVVTAAASWVTYLLVERPGIALGHRLSRSGKAASPGG